MRIISNNIDFDLPVGFAAELTRNNVLLTDAGEQTSPITLPGTPKNLQLVGYSDRLDNVYKPITDLDVTVIDGLFYRQCNLGIHTANAEDGISCTIYLGTGEFYSKVGERKLASLAWPIIKSPNYNTETDRERIAYLCHIMRDVFLGTTYNPQFGVTRVVTSKDYTWIKQRLSAVLVTVANGNTNIEFRVTAMDYPGKLILNGFSTEHMLLFPAINESVSLTLFEGEDNLMVHNDTTHIPLPYGYGMTPFLRIRYILEIIFSDYTFDFTAITAKFADFDNDLLVNNVADAICAGYIMYSQLAPDVTVKVFLAFVEKRYGGKFIINENTRSVFFCDYDVVQDVPDIDLTNYLTSKIKIGASEFENTIVQYNSDIKVENDESKTKQTILDFDFMKRVEMKIETAFGILDNYSTVYYSVYLTMILVDVGDIIHKNSKVVVDGKTIVEEATKQTDIKIITLDAVTNSSFTYTNSNPKTFTTNIYNPYTINSIPIHPDVKSFYEKYIAFKSGSNIPVETEMLLPASEQEKLQLHVPKILQGQPVMIENIKYVLGKEGKQTVLIRTLRPYSDR